MSTEIEKELLYLLLWFFLYDFLLGYANDTESHYYSSRKKIEGKCFVKPKVFKFLFKKSTKYPKYIGVLKDRYYVCCILFVMWCVGICVQLLGFFIGPNPGLNLMVLFFLTNIILTLVYVIPYEEIFHKKS